MARSPVFALAQAKIGWAETELARVRAFIDAYGRSDLDNLWSRTATVAYAIHGIYNGLEDVMVDIARIVDASAPKGANSHQALLDQMHVSLDGVRPALLDDRLYAAMIELKSFRHLVRHQYGIDLVPAKVDANLELASSVLDAFAHAVSDLIKTLDAAR